MHTDPLPLHDEQPADSGLLDSLAALTGLFNPEIIWHEEEVLDQLNEQPPAPDPAAPAPAAE